MEQAVNQFNKGLLMDTHPMVLGNDTLSDCLNGTMITMSGNEVVLQNDMGNRRIDNAFLPSGYQPLGIKEYGGVIYVAAYNPLTNRGLIGSFPSPQRKINIDKDKGGKFNLELFIAESEYIYKLEDIHAYLGDTGIPTSFPTNNSGGSSGEGSNSEYYIRSSEASLISKDYLPHTISYSFESNTSWTVSENSISWCTVSPTSGTGNSRITINLSQNEDEQSRECTITITCTENSAITKTIRIYQEKNSNNNFGSNELNEIVDLGLSVKWSAWNLGASCDTERGGYYCWGDPTGTRRGYIDGSGTIQTLMNFGVNYRINLQTDYPQYDTAHQLLGGNWYTPTIEQMRELTQNCDWKYTENYKGVQGLNGYIVTGRGNYATSSIFIPRNGYKYYSNGDMILSPNSEGHCYYWTCEAFDTYDENNPSNQWNKPYAGELAPRLSFLAYKTEDWYARNIRPIYIGNINQTPNPTSNNEGSVIMKDLGLSVLWADRNIGATIPEDKGDYISWGELYPKENYSYNNYSHKGDSSITENFYLKPEYDAATQRWGNEYRMPTEDEISELVTNCECTWEQRIDSNGNVIEGMIYTSRINEESIFLPAGGHPVLDHYGNIYYPFSEIGYYWTNTRQTSVNITNTQNATCLEFSNPSGEYKLNGEGIFDRQAGLLIRPVIKKTTNNNSGGLRAPLLRSTILRSTTNSNENLEENLEETKDICWQIEKEYIIIPISDKIVLHTGDKFSIYSPLIVDLLPYLTLPEDIKNRLFTFQIGIFNSLNEFVDITEKLKTWPFNNVLGVNYNYFINTESGVPNETIADNELLRARNKLAINTYSLKMSSPLYLKAIVNHVSNISYSITEAEFIDNTRAKLKVEVVYQYNCPDEIDGQTFKMLFNDEEAEIAENENGEREIGEAIYLEEFNEYSKKIIYEVKISGLTEDLRTGKERYNYTLKFPLLHNFNEGHWTNPIYIKSLNKKGSIDLSKIGSNLVIFKGYRYFNNTTTKITTLEINLESYPKKNSNLRIEIVANPLSVRQQSHEIYTIDKPGIGTITTTFSYENFGERELYKLQFIKKLDGQSSVILDENRNHFFITTGIFNGNYIGLKYLSEEDRNSISNSDGSIKYSYDDLKDIYIEDFSIIQKLYLSPILKHKISNDVSESTLNVSGNYIFPKNYSKTYETYKINEKWDIVNTIDLHIEVNNSELYPQEIDDALGVENTSSDKLQIKSISNRTINDKLIINGGNNYHYYGDDDLYSNTSYNLTDEDGHIINITDLAEISDTFTNLLKVKLTSQIEVNNILKGGLIEKTIFCEHVITSFWDFVKKHYYSNLSKDNNSILLIKNPYFCFDFEGTDYLSATYTNNIIHIDNLKDNGGEKELVRLSGRKSDGSYIEEIARDCMSDKLNDVSKGNLFIIEVSTDDAVYGFYPCVQDDKEKYSIQGNGYSANLRPSIIAPRRSFRRIWMKINKLEYIPIFTTINRNSNGDLLLDNSLIDYVYLDKGFHNLLLHIPHCFEYETGGKTLPEKVFNTTNYSRTKEFEVDSNVTINIQGKARLINTNNSIFELLYEDISENISFKEGIIHSNLDFEEDFDNISNYKISCGLMDGDYDNHTLHIKDCNGKYFDPLYVYYNDNECKNNTTGKSYKPSYIAEKFYVPELDLYMPEIKSSRKLYAGKNGEHTLINEYVYPYKYIRNLLLQGLYLAGLSASNPYIPYADCDEGKWDKTLIQCEGNYLTYIHGYLIPLLDRANALVPLRTKNIFDRTYILGYGLVYSENLNSNNPMPNWIDYDDYINNLNS